MINTRMIHRFALAQVECTTQCLLNDCKQTMASLSLLVSTTVVPIFVLSVQYTLDRYRSIRSAIKCPYKITADDYFVSSKSEVYDAIQAAYLFLRIKGH